MPLDASLLLVLAFAAGCTSRFTRSSGPDVPAFSRTVAAREAARPELPLRVSLAGLPAALTDEQAASLKNAWEAASGCPLEIATTGANASADVILVSSSTLADTVAAKQIVALATAAAATAGDDVPETVRRALTWKGNVYALPLTARLRVLAYDPARLRAAGLDDRPAPTLESLRAQWQAAVTRNGAAVAATDGATQTPPATSGTISTAGESLADDVALFTAAFGGSLVEEDGALTLASKPAEQAVEFLKTLRERGLLPGGSTTVPTMPEPFGLIYQDGSAANVTDYRLPVVGLPPSLAAYDPATRPFVVSGEVFGVAVSAGARDRALAERFARFLTNPLVARGLLGDARSLAAPAETATETGTLARLAAHLSVAGGPLAHARNRAVLERYVRAALDGTLPVGEALAKASAEIEGRPVPANAAPAAPPVSDKPGAVTSAPASADPPPAAAAPAP